jgi:hypothetical protein
MLLHVKCAYPLLEHAELVAVLDRYHVAIDGERH